MSSRAMTRCERGRLLRDVDKHLDNLKEELINPEVTEMAINIHGILVSLSAKFTSDAIVEIIPQITLVLNRFDASLKVNADLQRNLMEASDENTMLKTQLEVERKKREQDFEESLNCEEKADEEITYLKLQINTLETTISNLKDELSNNNQVIKVLNTNFEDLRRENIQITEELGKNKNIRFALPKKTAKPISVNSSSLIQTANKYSILDPDTPHFPSCGFDCSYENDSPSSMVNNIIGKVILPGDDCPTTPARPVTGEEFVQPATDLHATHTRRKRRSRRKLRSTGISVSVFSDSHGRGMSAMLANQFSGKNTNVKPGTVKPGAPLAEVLGGVQSVSEGFKKGDYIICIAGTNDINREKIDDKAVVSIYSKLSVSAPQARFIVATIPPRYDCSPFSNANKSIRYLNSKIKLLEGKHSNVKVFDLGAKLPHLFNGIHFNTNGKKQITREMYSMIEKWACIPYPAVESPKNLSPSVPGPSRPRLSLLPTTVPNDDPSHAPVTPNLGTDSGFLD